MSSSQDQLVPNFFIGQKLLLYITGLWVLYQMRIYHTLTLRPSELFIPSTWFHRLLMPQLPSLVLGYAILILTLFTTGVLLFINLRYVFYSITKLLLTGFIVYVNVMQWSYGYLAHVGHHLLFAHLFALFIPIRHTPLTIGNEKGLSSTIISYYVGLLATFSISGLWKARDIAMKLFYPTHEIHWLNPEAAYRNGFVSYTMYDLSPGWQTSMYEVSIFWQIAFVVVTLLQIMLPLFAIHVKLHKYVVGFVLVFFISNAILIKTVFVTAPIVLIALFFPYHTLIQKFKFFAFLKSGKLVM
jgi:hypothetical protein